MTDAAWKKPVMVALVFLGMWLAVRYVLPVMFPFVIGLLLAVAAEPLVRPAQKRIGLPRAVAAGLGVALMLVLIFGILSLSGALVVKEVSRLSAALPKIAQTTRQGAVLLEDWLVSTAQQAPEELRVPITNTVLDFFDDGTVLMQQAAQKLPEALRAVLSWVPDSALGLGTSLLAGFMISCRLPVLRQRVVSWVPQSWKEKYLPVFHRIRRALSGWLKAQLKLSGLTWLIVSAGFLLLRIPYALLWAGLVAVVDAVPMLGTGTVLLPWAAVCFLQGNALRATGLIVLFGAALIMRTVLEPRLVGKQLGLDPLLTLVALYLGYRFWGILGMLVMPVLAAAAKSVFSPQTE